MVKGKEKRIENIIIEGFCSLAITISDSAFRMWDSAPLEELRLEPASPHELSNCDRPIERARYIQLPETREQAPMAWAHALMFRQHAFLTLKKSPSVSNFAPACVFRRNLSPGAISSNQYSDGSEFVPLICRGGVQQENSLGCLGY